MEVTRINHRCIETVEIKINTMQMVVVIVVKKPNSAEVEFARGTGVIVTGVKKIIGHAGELVLDELERHGVATWQDLPNLQHHMIDDLRLIRSVFKMKIHQLVELMQIEGTFDPSHDSKNTIRRKLNEVKFKLKHAAEAKHRDELIHENLVKITMSKFNDYLESYPAYQKQVTNAVRSHNMKNA